MIAPAGMRTPIAAALTAICLAPLAYQLFQPFITSADNNTASFAVPARNYVRHGPIATRMGLALSIGESAPERFSYNAHHPPLAALGAAGAFLLLGVADWTARIYPAACTLGSALLVFLLWRRVRGEISAALATTVMVTLPAYGHFGKMLGEESPTLFFGLLTMHLYQRWKQALPGGAALRLAGCLAAYAAGSLSGWAGLYVGPILMADALFTLRPHARHMRSALLGFTLTGLTVFALILLHFAWLAGSLDDILKAASGRIAASASPLGASGMGQPWLARESDYFLRLYGLHAAVLCMAGLLAGVIALAQGRARKDLMLTALALSAFGLAHPLVFPWAAYYHDWLLFHLLPVVAIAAAEGTLLLAGVASWAVHALKAPRSMAAAAAVAVAVLALGHRAYLGAQSLRALSSEEPRYAWPLLGREIARMAPAGSKVLANLPFHSAPLRFYADRPASIVTSLPDYERVLAVEPRSLYVRDLNIPIDPRLEERLGRHLRLDAGSYRIYDLTRPAGEAPADEAGPDRNRPPPASRASLQADFAGIVRLTGYEVSAPREPPEPVPSLLAFLGLSRSNLSAAQLVRVTSFWSATDPNLPDWKVWVAMLREADGEQPLILPLVSLPEEKRPVLSRWQGRESFTLQSSFLFPEAYPPGDYALRFAVMDGYRPIPPVLPGPPRPLLKSVVAGPVPLFVRR